MDIGEPQRIIRIEPAQTPVPERAPATPERAPRRFEPVQPTKPVEDPTKVPEKVPA